MPRPRLSPNAITPETSLMVATLAHQQMVAASLHGMDAVAGATVASEPQTIYDLNGEPLFHDYALVEAGTVAGTVRTAAHRALGAPLISVSHSAPGWNAGSGRDVFHEASRGAREDSPRGNGRERRPSRRRGRQAPNATRS